MNGTDALPNGASSPEPIAIVGMSCKFAGSATNPSKLWDVLVAGKDNWTPIPESRFDVKSLYHPDGNRIGRHNVKGGYFIEGDIHSYDAAFFKDPADSAAAMDPQLRLIMEGVYEAIENAGIALDKLAGSNTSVYAGVFGKDNNDMLMKDAETIPHLFITGNGLAMFSNRISHFYNLRGPSLTIDVGCSGSMAALHLAVQSLRSGESSMSIVGASAALLNPDLYIALSKGGILNPEGRCYAWDHRWGGYGRGEGSACLILKTLSAALADGDYIHAVIRETALNQDGRTGTITSPSMEAQKLLMEHCYTSAGLDMSTVGYVEAHMTGTGGDPIEAESIAKTFGLTRTKDDPLYVGSVKTNIGHTESVSGIAAVIKTAMILKHRVIPPNLNYERTNPNIPLDEWNLRVPTALTPWPSNRPLRASINNFGYGGTNGHLILEAAPDMQNMTNGVIGTKHLNGPNGESEYTNGVNGSNANAHSYICVISSKDAGSTKDMNRNMAMHLRKSVETGHAPKLSDLAFTLAERRTRHQWATAVRARTLTELIDRLEEPHRSKPARAMPKVPRVGFVFTGQGAQWFAMGRELISTYSTFKTSMLRATDILQKEYGASWSLLEELTRNEATSRVHDIDMSQPLTVAVQLCLVDLLQSWNITAAAVVSHSSGEIAAGYAAGVLSFKEALGVVYFRGSTALKHQKLSPVSGGMLAARTSSEEAEKYIKDLSEGTVVVACINSPTSVTLSGDMAALEEVAERLEDEGVFTRKLKVPMAYHSHHMRAMAPDYKDALRDILPVRKRLSKIPFASPVTGDLVTSPMAFGADHWVKNLVSPVLFSQAVEKLASNVDVLLEIGAHDTLSGPVRQTLGDKSLPYSSCLKRPVNAVDTMQDLVCELSVRGYPVSLAAVNLLADILPPPKYVGNLPSYAWNHSSSYHAEPRISREHRSRRFPPHELLGSPVPGINKHMPTWRNFLRIQDVPWLQDHKLEGQVVLPGAGYIAMAIEAVRLLRSPSPGSSTDAPITGYRLRDIEVINALIVPTTQSGVETMFSLRSCSERELDHREWYEFEVWSVAGTASNPSWVQHCTGCVAAESQRQKLQHDRQSANDATDIVSDDLDATAQLLYSTPPSRESFLKASKGSQRKKHLEAETIFSNMAKMDFFYGPAFQNLIGSDVVGGRSITDFRIAPTALEAGFDADYVLHPTTLDSVFQCSFGCLTGEAQEAAVFLPRRIGGIFVPSNFGQHAGHKLEAFMELSRLSGREAAFDGLVAPISDSVRNEDSSDACLRVINLQLSRIRQENNKGSTKRLYAKSRWEPDFLHDIPASIKDAMRVRLSESELDFHQRLRESSYHYIRDACSKLDAASSEKWQWHHRKLYDWMQRIVKIVESGELEKGCEIWPQRSEQSKQVLFESVRKDNVRGEMICKIGPKLVSIIEGEVMPLELMMENRLLHRFYEEEPEKGRGRVLRKSLRQLMGCFIAKEPGARVLEIGAGTGSATQFALEALTKGARDGGGSGSLLDRYDFTDISAGFFESAQSKFSAYSNVMSYNKLDIEMDPQQQGFTCGSYDLVIAAEVLHATKNLKRTLTNARKLLKPGGKLLLVESGRASPDTQLIFGTLPGWWLSEEPERGGGPLVEVHTWDQYMQSTGFTGVDFALDDCEDREVRFSTLMLTTAASPPTLLPSEVSIVHDKNAPDPWLNQLATTLNERTGNKAVLESLELVQPHADRTYIVTLDMSRPFIDNISGDVGLFDRIRALLVNSHGVFWLSCGGGIGLQEPRLAQSQGLLRALRREDASKRLVQLDLDSAPGHAWTSKSIQHIVDVFSRGFDEATSAPYDWEYAIKDSILHVPRVYPDPAQDALCGDTTRLAAEPQPFNAVNRDLVWEPSEDGLLDKLQWAEHPCIDDLSHGKVEIETKVFGLNFRDVLISIGMLTPDENGRVHEAAGVVTRLGPGTDESGLKVGDRVCGVFDGFFASRSYASWMHIAKIPDDMTIKEGVSIPYAFLTAYHGLLTIARLRKGQRVLIHAAAGGVGQAAVMIAQDAGAEVFVTCGTPEKRQLLEDHYGIPDDHIFSSRDISFAQELMLVTKGEGVDVVLNSLAGPLLKATWECLSLFGVFVEVGKMDIEAAKNLDMTPFGRAVTFAAVDLSLQRAYTPKVLHEELAACVDLCRRGRVRPVHPITAWSVDEMEKAMEHMQAGKHIGKIVIETSPDAKVPVLQRSPPLDLADQGSTYLIVGGMTGLGYAIASHMIEKGASNLLVVSRNAAKHAKQSALRQKALDHGCNLQVRDCDVSNEKAFLDLLADTAKVLPPIRGVVQGGMVLDDTVFERMSHEQWQTTIMTRVAGTLHIHNHLPNLRFFIMLSSTSGVIGTISQSNYCASNSFLDALARHRTAQGLPAVTIDLGRVEDAGYVHEAPAEVSKRVDATYGTSSVPLVHLMRLVEQAIREPLRRDPDDSQIITGWSSYDQLPQFAKAEKRFGTLRLGNAAGTTRSTNASSSSRVDELIRELMAVGTSSTANVDKAGDIVRALLAAKVGEIFNIDALEVDLSQPLTHFGVDSLIAVQLRNWMTSILKARVTIFEILQTDSLHAFATLIASRSSLIAPKLDATTGAIE